MTVKIETLRLQILVYAASIKDAECVKCIRIKVFIRRLPFSFQFTHVLQEFHTAVSIYCRINLKLISAAGLLLKEPRARTS
jgi:hypothetical protein